MLRQWVGVFGRSITNKVWEISTVSYLIYTRQGEVPHRCCLTLLEGSKPCNSQQLLFFLLPALQPTIFWEWVDIWSYGELRIKLVVIHQCRMQMPCKYGMLKERTKASQKSHFLALLSSEDCARFDHVFFRSIVVRAVYSSVQGSTKKLLYLP